MRKRTAVKVLSVLVCVTVMTGLFSPHVYADELVDVQQDQVSVEILPSSFWYNFVKIKESIQLDLLTFKKTSKAVLLEKFVEQRMDEMKYAESIGDYDALDSVVERYNSQKTNVLKYAESAADDSVMKQVKENTLKQQQTMTQMQLRLEDGGEVQKNIVQVQNSIAKQTKEVLGVVLGDSSSVEFNDQVHVVWMDPNADDLGNLPPLPDTIVVDEWEYAPGTEGRNEAGVVVEYSVAVDNVMDVKKVVVVSDDDVDGGNGSDNGEGQNVVVEENLDDPEESDNVLED